MGQGACGGYLKSPTGHSVHKDGVGQDSNNNKMSEKLRISQLEHMLQQKNTEIEALQVKINIKNSALCSRNFQNVKLRSTIQELICHSILLLKSILARFEYQKLPFLQFQKLSTLKFCNFGT